MKKKTKKAPKSQQEDKNYIEVMAKIFAVLEFFIQSGNRQSAIPFSEVAAAVPFARTTVHRILYSLEKLNYIEKESGSGHYQLAAKFFDLTGPAIHFRRLQAVAKNVMQNLLLRFGETVNLGVLDDGHVVYIDVLQSPSALRIAAVPGERNPAHSTSLGKVLLAFLPENEITAVLEQNPMVRKTPKTITQRTHFIEHLASVRETLVAFDMEENLSGVICVASPVFDQTGRVIAGLSVSGPVSRMEPKLAEVQEGIREASAAVSRMIAPGATSIPASPGHPLTGASQTRASSAKQAS